jgi:glutathione S-transferase
MKLFYAPGACSLAPHIMLEELGLPSEAVRLDLTEGDQHRDEFLAVNPKARVPALVTDQGVLTECPAILTYLGELQPSRGFMPPGAFGRAKALEMMAWLSSHVHIAFAHYWRGARFSREETAFDGMRSKAVEDIGEAFRDLDRALNGRAYIFDRFTVVDPYVLVFRRWGARIGLDMAIYPNVVGHGARVAERPAAARAIARESIRIDS